MNAAPLRVLVVDDDEDDFVLIRDLLNDAPGSHYAFDWCATPQQGLEELRRGAHDVYLVDYLLGPSSGLDLIEAVSREGLSRAFIVLTGRGNHAVDVAAMEAGASDYLVKGTIDAERLDRSIRYAVDRMHFMDALRDSEAQHRLLFEQSPVPLLVFDRHSRAILNANAAAHAQYGWSPLHLLGQTIDAVLATEERSRFLADLASGELFSATAQTWSIQHNDGRQLQVEGLFHPLAYHGVDAVLAHLQDITERRRVEAQLRLLERAIQSTGSGVVIADAREPGAPVTFINRAFEHITGYDAAEVIGQSCRQLAFEDSSESERAMVRRALAEQREYNTVLRDHRKDGTPFWNQLYFAPVRDTDGATSHYIGILSDITEHRDTEARLAYAATHDVATGLARFPVIETMLQEHAEQQPDEPFSLVFGDIDRFHAVNEAMGYEVGDRVIEALAQRLSALVGTRGRVARFTGNEFVIALPHVEREEAVALAEQLRRAVAEPVTLGDGEVRVTISVGVATYPGRVHDINDLLRRAEASMSRAKQLGRDLVCEYSTDDMRRMEDRRMLGIRLRHAMQHDELHLVYQPEIRSSDRAVIGFEALLRWNSPEMGLVMPERFIPVAEALGLMPELGGWVLDRACAQSRAWMDAGLGDFFVAVNVSAQQIQRGNFAEQVADTLRRHGLPADRLELELTESALLENVDRALHSMQQLSTLGVHLSFDDFGTGYSSLSYLRQFHVDKLKIDKSFVFDIPRDASSIAIANTVVAIGHQLRMTVIAEGVETAEQAQLLTDMGCDALQGYLFSRPMKAQAVAEWLADYQIEA
ncbi:EAL domain-containing protein [Rhodanobacter caeni]|uniref:EAL domain-containing protein n=1 Tax=Rhodanobacter caeni TaxID=657654 RepID=A0ABN0UGI1_9GAMM